LLPKAELLNQTLFTSLAQARVVLESWRTDYNGSRPHSKLGWKTPSEFALHYHDRPRGLCNRQKRTHNWIKLGRKVMSDSLISCARCNVSRFLLAWNALMRSVAGQKISLTHVLAQSCLPASMDKAVICGRG
jgi:Integrase core domain